MNKREQKVRAQAEEWGAEIAVTYGRGRTFTVSAYSKPGTRFCADGTHSITEYRGPGNTLDETWEHLYERMAEGIEDCPESCECRDEEDGA